MSMNVDELVLLRFVTLYGAPTSDDPEAFKDEYREALTGTNPEILKEAISLAIKRQTVPAWPPVGACVAAVHEVAERRAVDSQRIARRPVEYRREPTPEQKARAAVLVKAVTEKLRANERAAIEKRIKQVSAQVDWGRTAQPEWDERMATSDLARALSLPRGKS